MNRDSTSEAMVQSPMGSVEPDSRKGGPRRGRAEAAASAAGSPYVMKFMSMLGDLGAPVQVYTRPHG